MLDKHDQSGDANVGEVMARIGVRAKSAARILRTASSSSKNEALNAMAEALWQNRQDVLDANSADMEAARNSGLSAAFLDRLQLDEACIEAMVEGLRAIAAMPDPIGAVMAEWDRPNGLHIERVRTPLGVIGVIYESRPNVTADAGALCLKSGNAVILRGGSDGFQSSHAIHACLVEGLLQAGLPGEAIQIVPTADRAAVGEMLSGLDGAIDVIIPRGGKSLVERVQNDARVPVFAHLEGVCHVYIDQSADLDMAIELAVNSKMRRTGICGAAETLLVDRAAEATHLVPILEGLQKAGCTLRGDKHVRNAFDEAEPAIEKDWHTEYLDTIITVGLVDGVAGAIAHIEEYSSDHTESIIAEDAAAVEEFFEKIDSAILLHNASTQFADGAEFGMGAEIGIATGKMHARGPVGIEQLTSFKYRVRGTGQSRP